MQSYIDTLKSTFTDHANAAIAIKQKAYMRNQFEFYGLTSPIRRKLQKPFLLKESLPDKADLHDYIVVLWQLPQRDYQLMALDLLMKYVKRFERGDILLLEYMATNKSWWDTVDLIAVRLIGSYFKSFPEQRNSYVKKWLASNNIWLQRSVLLFQLKYKSDMDTALLQQTINGLLGSYEFFINKAIGWVLREYSRTNPEWVSQFVHETELSNLSKREALRLLS